MDLITKKDKSVTAFLTVLDELLGAKLELL